MNIQEEVLKMYEQAPYPDYGDDPLEYNYLMKKKYIDLILGFEGKGFQVYQDKKILEGGCGTGRESIYVASMGGRLSAIDLNDRSLEVAKKQAAKMNFDIQFMKASVFNIPFDDDYFDIVISSGVIHHTENPEKAFAELVRVLKPEGYLILYVYNNFAHIISNLRRGIVIMLAGDDVTKRVKIAQRIFPRYLRKKNLSAIYDEFGHPHKSEHGIREVLSWFENN